MYNLFFFSFKLMRRKILEILLNQKNYTKMAGTLLSIEDHFYSDTCNLLCTLVDFQSNDFALSE